MGILKIFDGSDWIPIPPNAGPKVTTAHFAMDQDVSNSTVYFFSWRGAGNDAPGNKRSGNTSGVQNANSCSPYQVPYDAKITSAVLTVKGVGVQNGSVTYPVSFEMNLNEQGFTADSKVSDVDFSISSGFTVGAFSVADTHFFGSTALDIDVTAGQLLGLEFENGTGASVAAQMRNAWVTLILEENL